MTTLPVDADELLHAQHQLQGVAIVTPVLDHPLLDAIAGRHVACKAEALQRAGSFKFRGAYNALAALDPQRRARGVVGASSGNHAQALALAGRLLSTPVTVVTPHDAPANKIDAARAHGATVVTYHRGHDDRDAIARQLAADHGATIVPSADHPEVIAGAGTAALELLTQAPDLAAVLVPVGGGGLAAGTALAAQLLNPGVQVIGVEPATGADTAASLHAGRIVELPAVPDTIADGLRHTRPADLPWEINRRLLADVVTVTDTQIAAAMSWAFEFLKVVAEPSGAVALAAVTTPGLPPGPIGAIISGASVALHDFHHLTTKVHAASAHA